MKSSTRGLLDWLYRPPFPADWEKSDLYNLAIWLNGMAFRDFQFADAGKPIIKIAEIKNGITGQTKFTMSEYDPAYYIKPGDMLFAWSGQPDTSIDVYWWRGPEGWLNQHIFKVTPSPKCHPVFFYYLLKYLKPNFVAIARNKQTTGLGHVTVRDLSNMSVGIPDRRTQKAIAHILGTLDDKIELNRQMNATLEAIARALFKSWFVDFDPVRAKAEGRQPAGMDAETAALFPAAFVDSELGEIPKGWRVAPLPEVFEVNPSRSLKNGDIAPYLDMANMPTQGHRAIDWLSRPFGSGTRFINGDTLVARITPCLENGKTAFVDFLADGQVGWGSTEYIVLRPKPPLPLEYAYLLARGEDLRAHLIQNMTGTSGRQRAPASCLDQYLMVVPSQEVARRFDGFIRPVFATIRANDEQSRTLAALRDALLPKLISGEIRIKDAVRLIPRI